MMDDFLMEPLSYEIDDEEPVSYEIEDVEEDNVKSGRKRSGSEDIEGRSSKKSTKRQRVGSFRALAELNTVDLTELSQGDADDVEVIVEKPLIPVPGPSSSSSSCENRSVHEGPSSTAGNSRRHQPSDATTANTENDAPVVVKFRRVLKRIPQDIPYLPLTCQDGTRLYLRLKEIKDPKIDDDGSESVTLISATSKSNLIANWNQVKSDARVIKDKFHKELAKAVANDVVRMEKVCEDETENIPDCLWVEKYKPRSFLDLLSQEGVNTALLHWIKLWDKSVFGKDYLAKVKANREKYSKLEAQEKEKNERFQRKTYLPSNEEYDEGGRPNMKVALLAGDPGLGKTTCAHVIAKHAGYNIRELNASDDRSIELFRKAIDDTTQSRSEIFQEGKPNCLIIDEIDGAPLASVNVLVELMTGNATESGRKKLKKFLRRPVVCICNDLYAPSLKLLRKHAFVLQFPAVSVPRLFDRLTEVSDREQLHLDANTLKSLCQKSECDIRSCLSTLQFLKRKRCTPKDALFAQIGGKDKSKGIFAVWNEIFCMPQEKKYQDFQMDPSKSDVRFRNVLYSVQSFGEYDKLFGGIHENYLNVKYRDAYMQQVIEGLEWATWFEDIREYVEKTQTYGLFGYLPMYFVKSHFLFARTQHQQIKIQFPSIELASRLPKYRSTIKSQIAETSASTARFLDPYMLITDIFPALISIIQPCNIRPVPTQIWTQRERDTLKNVVEVMLTYNLCYTQTKNPETGAYTFIVEPDIEEMVKFKLQDSVSSKKAFPYAIKQLISREIETEKLRRNDMTPDVVQKEIFRLPETPKASSSKSQVPKSISKTPVAIVARDFFGRPILPSANVSPEADTKTKKSHAVYYRFKEGYSNAVRRFVKMRDLS